MTTCRRQGSCLRLWVCQVCQMGSTPSSGDSMGMRNAGFQPLDLALSHTTLLNPAFFQLFPIKQLPHFCAAQCRTLGQNFSSPRKPIFKQQIGKMAPISPISMIKNGSKMAQVTQKNIPSDFKCSPRGNLTMPGHCLQLKLLLFGRLGLTFHGYLK